MISIQVSREECVGKNVYQKTDKFIRSVLLLIAKSV